MVFLSLPHALKEVKKRDPANEVEPYRLCWDFLLHYQEKFPPSVALEFVHKLFRYLALEQFLTEEVNQ